MNFSRGRTSTHSPDSVRVFGEKPWSRGKPLPDIVDPPSAPLPDMDAKRLHGLEPY